MSEQKSRTALPWATSEIPVVLTYIYPPPDAWEPRYQLQWDYQIEWPKAGRPTITLLRFRSFQQKGGGEKAELIEEITDEIPVNEAVMIGISKHAAGWVYASSDLDGAWRLADGTFMSGLDEAANKRFSLALSRRMAQATPENRGAGKISDGSANANPGVDANGEAKNS